MGLQWLVWGQSCRSVMHAFFLTLTSRVLIFMNMSGTVKCIIFNDP